MKPWTTFGEDINDAIQAAMEKNGLPAGTPLTVGNAILVQTDVATEEELRAHITYDLNLAVESVLAAFKIEGRLVLSPAASNVAIVGEPDFSWVSSGSLCSKLPVRVSVLPI